MIREKYIELGLLAIISILFAFLHREELPVDLNGIHLWRQTETQTNILQFYRHDNNIFNPRCNTYNGNKGNIKRFEFPIMQWLIANSYRIFGEDIKVTRWCMMLIAIIGYIGMYRLSKILTKKIYISILLATTFLFSPIYYFYAINPLPDMFALMCSIWFFYYFIAFVKTEHYRSLYLSALFLCIAILAKLPYVIYGLGIAAYFFSQWWTQPAYYKTKAFRSIIISFGLALVPPILWYAWVMPTWYQDTVIPGILNAPFDKAKYLNIIKYHKNTILPEYLFNKTSIWFLYAGLFFIIIKKGYKSHTFWIWTLALIACFLYFLYELNMIDVIHDYYMLPFMLPLYMVALYGIFHLMQQHLYIKIITIFLIAILPRTSVEATKTWWTLKKVGIPEEWIKYKNELRSVAPSDALCAMLNDDSGYIMPYLMDKQGYFFQNDHLPVPWVDDMVRNWKVQYLYSNSRKVDADTALVKYIDKVVFDKGNMKVFKLKIPK